MLLYYNLNMENNSKKKASGANNITQRKVASEDTSTEIEDGDDREPIIRDEKYKNNT